MRVERWNRTSRLFTVGVAALVIVLAIAERGQRKFEGELGRSSMT